MHVKSIVPVMLGASLAAGGVFAAQHESPSGAGMDAQGTMQQQTQAGLVTLQGKVLEHKQVQVKGGDAHMVVLLGMEGGQRAVVDLGPVGPLTGHQIDQGDQLSVMGQPGRVEDRVVLFASQMTKDGQQVAIQRPAGEQQRQMARKEGQPGEQADIAAFMEQPHSLKGTIAKQKEVQVKGSDRTHRVLLVESEQGPSYVVDVGPSEHTAQANLEPGAAIDAKGKLVRIGDRLVLMADEATIDEQSVRIERRQGPSQ